MSKLLPGTKLYIIKRGRSIGVACSHQVTYAPNLFEVLGSITEEQHDLMMKIYGTHTWCVWSGAAPECKCTYVLYGQYRP